MKKRYLVLLVVGMICLTVSLYQFWQTDEPTPQTAGTSAVRSEQHGEQAMVQKNVPIAYSEVRSSRERPAYDIEVQYDEKNYKLVGKQRVTVPNLGQETWPEIYFHLFPNAFKDWSYNKAAAPEKEGYIKVSDITVNGVAVKPEIDKTLMKLVLAEPLPAHKKATVEMAFTVQLPEGGSRLNHVAGTAFLAQWYPMLAVYDREGWHKDRYTTIGDPFYTKMADFTVTFRVPKGYRVISTAPGDGRRKLSQKMTLKQRNVRDFAAVVTKDYRVRTGKVGDTVVNLWYRGAMKDVAAPMYEAAVKAMRFFNESFGTYPYEEIDVVLGEHGHGIAGMEYPGLVTSVDRIMMQDGEQPAVNVVAHELAHQWWYGMVGNDQVKEPWLDEGLTSFSESLYMRKVEGKDEREMYAQAAAGSERINKQSGLTVVQKVYDYPEQLYGLMVYARPTAMMWALVDEIGEQKVIAVMREYFTRYKDKEATTADFIRTASEVSNKDLQPFFDKWLYFKDEPKSKKKTL
ncbi:M1 family metallopeptidase [Numidum massiliense]|uniref:M1 family metallopeptidase n=1 Tax=Numidum massiliense TaxID=1522315 RepID=UPI0006D555FF|nr:M1 family metallopeptidase [Numidum massiliense]